MPIYKSIQFSVYCDFCEAYIDCAPVIFTQKDAAGYFKSLGWKQELGTPKIWKCPKCVGKDEVDI